MQASAHMSSSPVHNPTVLRANPHTPASTICGHGTTVVSHTAAFLLWVLILSLKAQEVVVHPHVTNSIHSLLPLPSPPVARPVFAFYLQ